MKNIIVSFFTLLLIVTTFSCSDFSYEAGDSKYSYLTTEFVEAFTNNDTILTYGIDDNNKKIKFTNPIKIYWASRPDTLYRALLYYTKNRNNIVQQIVPITVLSIIHTKIKNKKNIHDPVIFESAWISNNRKYLNLGIAIKNGKSIKKSLRHNIAVICTNKEKINNSKTLWHLSFCHSQNNIPEYYSQKIYLSVPLKNISKGDNIILTINSYKGIVTRRFNL